MILSAFYAKFGFVTEQAKEKILKRLARIEGQIRGLSKMIDSEQSCEEITTQVSAAKSAIGRVGIIILEQKLTECLLEGKLNEEKIQSLRKMLIKMAGS